MLKSLFDVASWRIGAKIFAGFGSVIVLLALVSAFGIHELSSTGASVTQLNSASEIITRFPFPPRRVTVSGTRLSTTSSR